MHSPHLRRSTVRYLPNGDAVAAFSAPAEVNQTEYRVKMQEVGILRTCGGQPRPDLKTEQGRAHSPHLRRSTAQLVPGVGAVIAFSAPAEVNRNTSRAIMREGGILRTCGGQP